MFEEEYRQIEGYDNYSVSNHGNVRINKTGLIKKAYIDKIGYLRITLCKENIKKTYLIHRLVGIAFLPNPDNLELIDHINQIKDDNRVENLRWISKNNNERNKKKKEGTTSKYIGVGWHKRRNKWRAYIKINNKFIHLGQFETEEQAYDAWCEFVKKNNLQEFYGL